VKEHFLLDPDVVFLNHGSFGACPRPVFEAYQRYQRELERQPVEFLALERRLPALLDEARVALAGHVGANADNLAFATNATSAVNATVRSLDLGPDDEVLMGDDEYGGMELLWEYVSRRTGARIVRRAFDDLVPDERTKVLFCSHIEWTSGRLNDVAELCRRAREVGALSIVDGAHAPGQIELDLESLGADVYAGNCHKWLCAPKGSAFLWVRAEQRPGVRPLTISHGANRKKPGRSRFRMEFDWTGTSDPTGWLTVPTAIACVGGMLPGGWPAVMARNHALAVEARTLLCAAAGTPPACPDTMLGSLASVILPDGASEVFWNRPDPLQARLFEEWRIEVPVMSWPAPPRRLIRISAQLYNARAQFARLADALGKELAR